MNSWIVYLEPIIANDVNKKKKYYYFIKISLLSLSSLNHTVTPLSHFLSFSLPFLWFGVSLRSVWTGDRHRRHGLKISDDSMVDWRLAATAWWFTDWWRRRGGLEWRWRCILSLSLIPILSCSHSGSLSQIGCGFLFCFEFLLWVLMLDSWWQRWGVAVLLVGMGSLWIYEGCDKCGWRFGGRGFVVFRFSLSNWV